MSSVKKKDLCLARSIGELNRKAQLTDKITKSSNPKIWLNSADKVFKKAEHSELTGDEENAYVFYMRFLEIIQEAKKTTKYKQDQKYYGTLVSKNSQLKALERAEKLAGSLEKRYKTLELETKQKLEKDKQGEEEKAKAEKQTKNLNGTSISMKEIDDLLSGKKPSTQTSADIFKKLQVNHKSILSPNDNSANIKDALIVLPPKTSQSSALNPVGLYQLLTDGNTKDDVLILDTRSKKDFELSRINYSCCINIPDDLLKTSVHVGSIERKLPKSTWNQWITRGKKGHIVILDQDTKYDDVTSESKVQCLKDAIYLYDTSCKLPSEPYLLDGGFEAWLWHYPSLVTNPMLPKKISATKAQPDYNLDSLSYPELPVSPEKAKPPITTTNGPNDRSLTNTDKQYQLFSRADTNRNTLNDGQFPNEFNPSSSHNGTLSTVPHSALISSTDPHSNKVNQSNSTSNLNSNFNPPKPVLGYPNQPVSQNVTVKSKPPQTMPSQTNVGKPLNHPLSSLNNNTSLPVNSPPSTLNISSSQSNPALSTHYPSPSPNNPSPSANRINASASPYKPSVSTSSHNVPRSQPGIATIPTNEPQLNLTNHGNMAAPNPSSAHDNSKPTSAGIPHVPVSGVSGNHRNGVIPSVTNQVISQGSTIRDPVLPTSNSTPSTPPQRPSPGPTTMQNSQPKPPMAHTPDSTAHSGTINNSVASPSTVNKGVPPVSTVKPTIQPLDNNKSHVAPQQPKDLPVNPTPSPSSSSTSHTSPTNTKPNSDKPVPSPQPTVPNVPQKFTSSRTGMTHGLPPGWERVLDHRTGRYYFRDHSTKTTHWNLPPSLAKSMNQNIMGHNDTTRDTEAKKTSLKRSLSSPNIAKLDTLDNIGSVVNERTNRPAVNRKTKPLSENQILNLAPAHGGAGKALTGLRNLGNSCYMNSILQCLISTAPLVKYIVNSYYVDDINKTNPLGTGGRIAEELAVLTRVAHSGSYRCVSPVDFKRTIGRFAPHFGGHQQQDSQEFLLFLLDQFHEDTNKVIKKTYIEEKSNDGLPDAVAAKIAWENHKTRNQSIIVELLQGLFKSTLTCDVCNKQSITFDAFMSLTLPIPTSGSCQIEDCIRLFTTKEKVSKDNKWFCPRCKQHREAWKTMEIWKLPPILIVHFNRFKRDYDGSWLEKRQNHVNFPLNKFDMAKFVLGPKKSLRYNLYGVSNHYGSMQSGHYTAFCKNIYDKKWYKFDDDIVSQMSESNTKSSAAYILCYTSIEFNKP